MSFPSSSPLSQGISWVFSSMERFSRYGAGLLLRPYQVQVLEAVSESVVGDLGRTHVVTFPRQSGKNEAQAQFQAWLLAIFEDQAVEVVSVSPTFKPQTLNAMSRLQRALEANLLTRGRWRWRSGFTCQLGRASIHFLSGDPSAHTVGATASLLLNIDEAQDVLKSTYDRSFAPMVASTNATRIFWGTAWTSTTLLSRERRAAEQAQAEDGHPRVWVLGAEEISAFHPPYGAFVASEVQRLGRDHPLIRTQYFSQEIDSQSGMFTPTRMALIHGDTMFPGSPLNPKDNVPLSLRDLGEMSEGQRGLPSSADEPLIPSTCAFLLDVAGQDESLMGVSLEEDAPLTNPGRDAVSLSIVSIDLSTLEDLGSPSYTVVRRFQWLGLNHLAVFGQLKNLAETWDPNHIVIDATGVGEGLWALLEKSFPTQVIPVKFSREVKSAIGWRFLAIIETGRFKDASAASAGSEDPRWSVSPEKVRLQYAHCRSEVLPGPGKVLRWGVPEGLRGPEGDLIHDDCLLADSLVARLDELEWYLPMTTTIIYPEYTALEEMDRQSRQAERRPPGGWYFGPEPSDPSFFG